jgi:hypothetical protein
MNAVVLGSIALGILSVFIRPEGVPLAHMVTDLPAKQGTGLLFLAAVLALFAARPELVTPYSRRKRT